MEKLTKQNINKVTNIMMSEYADAKCALDHNNVFELLIATVLSAQTTDVSVNKVTPALFKLAPNAKKMSKLSTTDVENIIHSIGMYKQKAKHIIELSNMLVTEYGGEVPCDFNELQRLPGVGRKTANVVLAVGFNEERIPVDTHVFRLANRIGLTNEQNVLATEEALMKILPHHTWTKMHHALINHGRKICSARNPKCEICCIKNICKKNML